MKRINLEGWAIEGDSLTLRGEPFHRLKRVLRVREGETVTGTDGRGSTCAITITAVGPDLIEGKITSRTLDAGESPLAVTLAQVIPRQSRLDLVVQKATELGVRRIVPLLAARSVARPGEGTERLRRWEKIAAEAVAQCRRARRPEISAPLGLADFLKGCAAPCRLLLQGGPGSVGLAELAADPPGGVELIVGPEGGFEEGEIAACRDAGFITVSLGPRILRTETAGLVALAVLQHRWGDLG
jgi:16S rRNA (uracil1498-N3)-methyltransferase